MKAIDVNGIIKVFDKIPKIFELKPNVFGYDLLDSQVHYDDGFRDYISLVPSELQRKDGYIFDAENDVYTDNIIDKTPEEIQQYNEEKQLKYKNKINSYFSYMYIRALSSSMNKNSNDLNYLLGLREEYTDKYNVSKGIITEGVTYDATLFSIQGEMDDEFAEVYLDSILPTYGLETTGTHLEKMFRLIVFKFEYGLSSFNEFNKFIRRFRTKCIVWLEASNFDNLDSAFSIVDSLPSSLTKEEAQEFFNQFNSI